MRVGDEVAIRERSKSLEAVTTSIAQSSNKHDWLDFDKQEMKGVILASPEREQIPENIKEQLIVELYSK
jgi:small subunit ribosomal protein S4